MSLIEQAARRLEQLRQAGVQIPEIDMPEPEAPLVVEPPARPQPASYNSAPAISRSINLDLEMLAMKGIVTPNAPRSFIADQYRVVKRPLISNAINRGEAAVKHANLIMVTSALSGEGKSFTSINLAMSIAAELDHTVMLVDADVARPSVLKVLGLDPAPGLLEVLEGKADLASTLLRTNVDKLTLLPSGTPPPQAQAPAPAPAPATGLRRLLFLPARAVPPAETPSDKENS